MKNRKAENVFARLFGATQADQPRRAATPVRKPAREATSFSHLRNAPRAALARMIETPKATDPWDAVHARTSGQAEPEPTRAGGSSWDASAKRIGAAR